MSWYHGDAYRVWIMNFDPARPAIFWIFRMGIVSKFGIALPFMRGRKPKGLPMLRFGVTVSGYVS